MQKREDVKKDLHKVIDEFIPENKNIYPSRKNVSDEEKAQQVTNNTRNRLGKQHEQIQKVFKENNFIRLVYCSFVQKNCKELAYTNILTPTEYPSLEECKEGIEERWNIEVEKNSVGIVNWVFVPKDYKLNG